MAQAESTHPRARRVVEADAEPARRTVRPPRPDERPARTLGGRRGSARGEELAAALEEVSRALDEHFDEEEREALPLVPGVVSQVEWDEIGDAASAAVPRGKQFTVLGMILKDTDPGEQILIMAHLPLPPRVLWRAVGERNFRRLEERLAAAVGHG